MNIEAMDLFSRWIGTADSFRDLYTSAAITIGLYVIVMDELISRC